MTCLPTGRRDRPTDQQPRRRTDNKKRKNAQDTVLSGNCRDTKKDEPPKNARVPETRQKTEVQKRTAFPLQKWGHVVTNPKEKIRTQTFSPKMSPKNIFGANFVKTKDGLGKRLECKNGQHFPHKQGKTHDKFQRRSHTTILAKNVPQKYLERELCKSGTTVSAKT